MTYLDLNLTVRACDRAQASALDDLTIQEPPHGEALAVLQEHTLARPVCSLCGCPVLKDRLKKLCCACLTVSSRGCGGATPTGCGGGAT